MRHLYQIPSSGYSSEYLAGRKFASRIIGGNNTLTYNAKKIRYYGQSESYWTQWHTKGFQNIKLVSLYSESVSHENSKCLHFVSVQVKHSPKQAIFFSHSKRMKNESYLTQWHTKGFQNIKLVSLYSKSVSHENFKCLQFASL